ncbi:MAG: response regulator transcription factor [Gemmatimonadaceae bacterium]|nr:response regulator transcription factor [Gemmatimonadaceae bacterium]
MSANTVRVVLADDHAVVLAGLRAVLGAAPEIQIVGEARNGADAVALAEKLDPDVIVMDVSMPIMDGTAATTLATERKLRARILILTMHEEEEYLVPLLSAGASGFLMKSAADRELIDAVRTVARGAMYIRPSGAQLLARKVTHKDPLDADRASYESLTERERDVLRYVAQGYTAPEIGEKLSISPKTVDTYKQRIGEKLGFTHRSDYVKLALRLGLLDTK